MADELGRAVYGTSFVNPLVEMFGEVYIGEESLIAGNTVLRAGEGQRVEIGNKTNAQDDVTLKVLRSRPSRSQALRWR